MRRMSPLTPPHHDVLLLRKLSGKRFPSIRQLMHVKKLFSPSERRIFNISSAVLVLGIVWLAVAYVSGFLIKVPTVKGEYTEGMVGTLKSVNPLFASLNEVDTDVTRLVYSGLMKFDKELSLIPDLAERYEVSPDKKVYTFFLRQGVKWHDDMPLTAQDVAYTFGALQDPSVGSPLIVSFRGITVEAVDEHTVRFTLPEQFPSFLSTLTLGIIPEHVWGAVPPDQIRFAQPNVQPIGSGPFKFKRLFKDQTGFIYRYELERFADYYGGAPFLKLFAFQFFGGYDTPDGAVSAVREQKIDGLSFVPLSVRDKVKRKHVALHTLQLPQYTALFFNQDRATPLKSKETRFALLHALDKERILRDTLKGDGNVIHGPILPGFPGYDPAFQGAPHSLDEANRLLDNQLPRISAEEYRGILKEQLTKEAVERKKTAASSTPDAPQLDEAGLKAAVEQEVDVALKSQINEAQLFYRKNKEGKPIELQIVTADTSEYRKVAEFIAGYWQEAGIKTKIEFVDARELPRRVFKDRNYDVLLYGVLIGGDSDQFPFWHSSQIDHPGLNLSRYVNRKVDDVLVKIRSTDKPDDLALLNKEFQKNILDDMPALFLYTPTYTYAISDKINGFSMRRITNPSDRFAQVNEWYTDTKHIWKFK